MHPTQCKIYCHDDDDDDDDVANYDVDDDMVWACVTPPALA